MEAFDRLKLRFNNVVADEVNKSQNSSHSLITAFVGYLRKGGHFTSAYAMIVAIFCAYSCRILIYPLWDMVFIPVISPLYKQQIHWLSTRAHFVSILLHVSAGIVCLLTGLLQFNSFLRQNNRQLHRWMGRLYVFCGVICLHSLWQMQGIVGKGPSNSPSVMLQSFNIVCIFSWSIATALALFYIILKGDYQKHKQWMIRSYCLLTTPLIQRSVNVAMSFMFYWLVVIYALGVDILDCYRSFESRHSSSEGVFSCLLVSIPHWSDDTGVSMLSLEGFGHAEHLVFGASAWFALLLILYMAEIAAQSVVFEVGQKGGNGVDSVVDCSKDSLGAYEMVQTIEREEI